MNWIKAKWSQFDAPPKTVRDFGLILSGLLFVLGLIAFIRAHHHWKVEWPLAAAALILVFAWPPGLSYLYRVWMILAERISWILLRILLAGMFYLVISPISILMRLAGKDVLDQKIHPAEASYWKKREPKPGVEHYERLF